MRGTRTRNYGWAAVAALALWSALPAAATEAVDRLLQQARDTEPDVKAGERLFTEHCAACHGPNGAGQPARNIPAIANQRQAYVIKQFADLREGEREAPPMHRALQDPALAEMQAWVNVAAYVNSLPPVNQAARGNGKFVSLGEAMYREQCSSCHGDDARGDEDGFVPSLRHQHYPYLLAEMDELAAGHRTNVDEDLIRFLSSLDADERMGLADYLSRMRGKTRNLAWLRNNGVAGD